MYIHVGVLNTNVCLFVFLTINSIGIVSALVV